MSNLLHPEIFEHLPFGGNLAESIDARASALSAIKPNSNGLSVLIRTRNDVSNLEVILDEIAHQNFSGAVQLVVVDTESRDGTVELAKSAGAEVLPISQDEFTYPLSLNKGMRAAAFNNVYSTVGHANLSNTSLLRAAAMITGNVAGAFGSAIPNANASLLERFMTLGQVQDVKRVTQVTKAAMGVMGANCAVFSRNAWEDLGGFDDQFQAGGEDTDLARRMLSAGMEIYRDPALSAHHSHGLGLLNVLRQYKHWCEVAKGPQAMDKVLLASRRPDLDI